MPRSKTTCYGPHRPVIVGFALVGVFSSDELVESILGARPKRAIMDELAEFLR